MTTFAPTHQITFRGQLVPVVIVGHGWMSRGRKGIRVKNAAGTTFVYSPASVKPIAAVSA